MSCVADTVSSMKSNDLFAAAIWPGSVVTMNLWAPSAVASFILAVEVLSIVTSAPKATPNFTAMCPRPPRPTTASVCALPTFHLRSGE